MFFLCALKPSLIDDGREVTRAVQYAHDRDGSIIGAVVDGVGAVKNDTQVGRKLWALWMRQGKGQDALAGGIQLSQETGRRGLRGFSGDVCPNLGQILLGAFG